MARSRTRSRRATRRSRSRSESRRRRTPSRSPSRRRGSASYKMPSKASSEVIKEMTSLYNHGIIKNGDLDDRVLSLIDKVTSRVSLNAFNELRRNNTLQIRNMSAYLTQILRKEEDRSFRSRSRSHSRGRRGGHRRSRTRSRSRRRARTPPRRRNSNPRTMERDREDLLRLEKECAGMSAEDAIDKVRSAMGDDWDRLEEPTKDMLKSQKVVIICRIAESYVRVKGTVRSISNWVTKTTQNIRQSAELRSRSR